MEASVTLCLEPSHILGISWISWVRRGTVGTHIALEGDTIDLKGCSALLQTENK